MPSARHQIRVLVCRMSSFNKAKHNTKRYPRGVTQGRTPFDLHTQALQADRLKGHIACLRLVRPQALKP